MHVEAEGTARVEAVREQDAVALHLVLSVMRPRAFRANRHRGNHARIRRRPSAHVDDGEKVSACTVGIARPDVQE